MGRVERWEGVEGGEKEEIPGSPRSTNAAPATPKHLKITAMREGGERERESERERERE
jgi:hypothetical protein